MKLLPNTSSFSRCTVRPNRLKYPSLEQRKVYCRAMHWLDAHEFGWTLGVGDGQGGLVCCDSWGRKELDTTEQLNWTELNWCWVRVAHTWKNPELSEAFLQGTFKGQVRGAGGAWLVTASFLVLESLFLHLSTHIRSCHSCKPPTRQMLFSVL